MSLCNNCHARKLLETHNSDDNRLLLEMHGKNHDQAVKEIEVDPSKLEISDLAALAEASKDGQSAVTSLRTSIEDIHCWLTHYIQADWSHVVARLATADPTTLVLHFPHRAQDTWVRCLRLCQQLGSVMDVRVTTTSGQVFVIIDPADLSTEEIATVWLSIGHKRSLLCGARPSAHFTHHLNTCAFEAVFTVCARLPELLASLDSSLRDSIVSLTTSTGRPEPLPSYIRPQPSSCAESKPLSHLPLNFWGLYAKIADLGEVEVEAMAHIPHSPEAIFRAFLEYSGEGYVSLPQGTVAGKPSAEEGTIQRWCINSCNIPYFGNSDILRTKLLDFCDSNDAKVGTITLANDEEYPMIDNPPGAHVVAFSLCHGTPVICSYGRCALWGGMSGENMDMGLLTEMIVSFNAVIITTIGRCRIETATVA